jgi:alkylation response protein AidB-like acyl-CoA dehydrogenase
MRNRTQMVSPTTARQTALLELADSLAGRFATRAATYDRENTFPWENFADLRAAGYLALPVPPEYGGGGASLLDLTLAQERLAHGDGATALATTMHLALLGRLGETRLWPEETFERVCRDVVAHGALINAVNSEPELGSPSRGALPSTEATRTATGWQISGRKSWASLAPALDYCYLLATALEDSAPPRRANFLVSAKAAGVSIIETWDTLGMRATASHDIVLDTVEVPYSARLPNEGSAVPGDGRGWSVFLVAAVYLGLAGAALTAAAAFIREQVAASGHELAQRQLGALTIELAGARAILYGTAEAWVGDPAGREGLAWKLAAVKYTATNTAITVTEGARAIVGTTGSPQAALVNRALRDARTGLGHPPMDDAALTVIGKAALGL